MSREELLQLLKENLRINIHLKYKKSSTNNSMPVILVEMSFDGEEICSSFIEPGEVRELMRYAS